MSKLSSRIGFGLAAGVAVFATTAAARPFSLFVPGLSFRVSSSTKVYGGDTPRSQDDEVMRGRGVAANNHARIEFLAYTPTPQNVTTDDYVVAVDSGKAFVFHAGSQTYTPANDVFGGPAVIALGRVLGGVGGGRGFAGGDPNGGGARRGGGGGRGGFPGGGNRGRGRGRGGVGAGFLDQIQLLDVSFKVEKLGAGETIDTRPTQHYKISADYRVVWGGQAFPAHQVTELWTVALPVQIPNPFEPLIVADQSTDGPLIEYALKLRAARAQVEGTPVKVVTTTTFSDVRDVVGFQGYVNPDQPNDKVTVVQQTALTAIQPADVDPKLVTVPDSISY